MFYQANYKFQYPIRLLYGFLKVDNVKHQIPIAFPATTDWGELIPDEGHRINVGSRIEVELGWLGIENGKIFYFRGPLDLPKEVVESDLFTLLIGLGNQGEIALWLHHELKNSLILYTHGLDISKKVTDEMIVKANILNVDGKLVNSIKTLCISDKSKFKNLEHATSGTEYCIEHRMKRFIYRYSVMFVSEPLEYKITEFLYDGCFDKTTDIDHSQYTEAAKPSRLSINWISEEHSGSINDYSAYIWLEETDITKIFDKFYGSHPETKTDLIIQIDAENKKYELALYRQGLKEPAMIPKYSYQLIVFKNKFEDYRSDNYNQPCGAWHW